MRTAATDNLAVYREVRAQGHDVRHMRFERHLETARPRESDTDLDAHRPNQTTPDAWEAIEPLSRAVPNATGRSPFRYFLDGAQRTLPSFFTDVVPISSSINVAAILERDSVGAAKIVENTLNLRHTWLIPTRTPFVGVNAVLKCLRDLECNIEDPLEFLADDDVRYTEALTDYDQVATYAKALASTLRQKIEDDLLESWAGRTGLDRDWIVVDGTLRRHVGRAVGLAKSFTYSYMTGEEYEALYRLKPGHRSRAFRFYRRFDVVAWYLRLWDPTGRDPRYSLVRIETTDVDLDDPEATDRIDELSAWLLAERIPCAKADERWATLLYPVHHLERILKRRLDMETRMWWQQS